MEKVVEADRFSGVAIAGAAGPAMEMVKLFQLQLEHYEKVEGTSLSLEGKANQLSMMVRGNLPGGDDGHGRRADLRWLRRAPAHRSAVGLRRHRRPVRGARLRRHRLGQPARRHRRQARLPARAAHATTRSTSCAGRCGRPPTPTRPPADPTRCAASTRSSPPSPPTASSASTTRSWRRATAHRRRRARPRRSPAIRGCRPMSMPFYVAPEQVMKDRADYARKGIARAGPLVAVAVRRRHRDGRRELVARRCARSARSTTASPSPASAGTTSSTSCASPACAPPTSRATSTAATTSTHAASPTSTPRSSARSSPTR